ncbi:hypothetical protein [Actinoplanes friuliensis]|jgi:hypothetical protein|uniref:Bacterial Pleckstrin homology domain-containing protein n=1 Tax=Actinoplanes friuliensis DSM 7358 TaxID=1246995 RepID=U5VP08_9ACTN|nr:hypothetical protein [Actinoplanes friuliensis]AGZ38524.1 hypothetical protein AFR_01175 [Actinoplanes friuliensis DSM 7358]
MAHVRIEGDDLIVDIEGLNKMWALKSRITVPLTHVRGATFDPGIVREPKGLRAPGTHVPGVIVAGTFHADGERVFWDVRDADKAVVIQLDDAEYARLVIEVDDPRAAVDLIEQALVR